MRSTFVLPTVFPTEFVIELKTNTLGSETSYTLKNSSGGIIVSRSGLGNNITYRDTVTLEDACYTLHLTDSGEDGLSWWANTAQGTGFFRIKNNISGAIIKTYNPDFGSNIYEQFTANSALTVKEGNPGKTAYLEIYPNPAGDNFTAEYSAGPGAVIQVNNVMGQTVALQQITHSGNSAEVTFDTSQLRNGVYFVTLSSDNYTQTQKLIIAK
jgi:hypothetical protein